MTATLVKHFDTLEFVKRSKALGANEQLAEYQARQIEEAIEIAVLTSKDEFHSKELANKSDVELSKLTLQKEIKELETNLLKEIHNTEIKLTTLIKNTEIKLMTLIGAQFIATLGILAKIFNWF